VAEATVVEAVAVVREGVTRTIRVALSHQPGVVMRTTQVALNRPIAVVIRTIRPALSLPTTGVIQTIRHATIPTLAQTHAATTAATTAQRPRAGPTLATARTPAVTSRPWRAQRLACAASVPTATLAVGMGASGAPGLSAPMSLTRRADRIAAAKTSNSLLLRHRPSLRRRHRSFRLRRVPRGHWEMRGLTVSTWVLRRRAAAGPHHCS